MAIVFQNGRGCHGHAVEVALVIDPGPSRRSTHLGEVPGKERVGCVRVVWHLPVENTSPTPGRHHCLSSHSLWSKGGCSKRPPVGRYGLFSTWAIGSWSSQVHNRESLGRPLEACCWVFYGLPSLGPTLSPSLHLFPGSTPP